MPHVRWNGREPIELVDNQTWTTTLVEPGHQVEVSAAVRDELVARGDDWSEVKDPGGAKAKAAAKKEDE